MQENQRVCWSKITTGLLQTVILTVLCLCLFQRTAGALSLLDGTYSTELNAIIADPIRNRIYVSDKANNRIKVINTTTLGVTHVALPGAPHFLALTKDNQTLGVALNSADIALVNLSTLTVTSHVTFPRNVETFDFDADGMVYFSTSSVFDKVWYGDPATGSATASFGSTGTGSFFASGLIRTNPAGDAVFVIDGPGGFTRALVSSGTVLSVTDASLGTGINDFKISPDGTKLYIASTIPRGVITANAVTLEEGPMLETQNTPVSVDITADGSTIWVLARYVIENKNLYQFSASTLGLISRFSTLRRPGIFFSQPQDRGMVTTPDGGARFYIEGYDGTVDPAQTGWVVGVQGYSAPPSGPGPGPEPTVPEIGTVGATPAKLKKKGGKVTITALVNPVSSMQAVTAQLKYKKYIKSGKLTLKSQTDDDVGTYQGTIKVKPDKKKLAGLAKVKLGLWVDATSTDNETRSKNGGKVTFSLK